MERFLPFMEFAPMILTVVIVSVGGWVVTTWLRVKHGYPLEGSWGQTIQPATSNEAKERIKLLASENAQLRAEIGSVKDRLAVLERIATDRGTSLSAEIEQLRTTKLN